MEQPVNRIAIAIASSGKFEPETVMSLVQGISTGFKYLCDFKVLPLKFVATARNELVRQTLSMWGSSPAGVKIKILWLDDDMLWPPHVIGELIAHSVPVVGGLYFKRTKPYDCAAFNFIQGDTVRTGLISNVCRSNFIQPITKWKPNSIEVVDGLGMGATMIDLDLFSKMREYYGDEKWFSCEDGEGEDVHFFHRLKTLGYSALLDTSIKCGHITTDVVDEGVWAAFHPDEALEMGFFARTEFSE